MASQTRSSGLGRLFLAASVVTVLTASNPRDEVRHRRAIHTVAAAKAQFASDDQDAIEEHCLGGVPEKEAEHILGPTAVIVRAGYVLEHSNAEKVPYWVAEHIRKQQLPVTANKRSGSFKPEPWLPPGERCEVEDYTGFTKIYDKGHLSPDANWLLPERKKETYFLSNVVPQHFSFNRGLWGQLEDDVRKWASKYGEVWVITGTLWYDPSENDSATANGFIPYDVIGNNVAVPTHLFKIVVRKDGNRHTALSYVMPNKKDYTDEDRDSARKQYSIDWIERESGYDFFPGVEDEQSFEAQVATEEWPLPQENSSRANRRPVRR